MAISGVFASADSAVSGVLSVGLSIGGATGGASVTIEDSAVSGGVVTKNSDNACPIPNAANNLASGGTVSWLFIFGGLANFGVASVSVLVEPNPLIFGSNSSTVSLIGVKVARLAPNFSKLGNT